MSRPAASRIEKLRELAREKPDDPDAVEIAAALDRVLQEGGSIDAALGLRSEPGQVSWWRTAAFERRDAALRELWGMQDQSLEVEVRLQRLSSAIRRYEEAKWKTHRKLCVLPANIKADEMILFLIFKSVDQNVPTSPKHLARILKL